MAIINNPRVPNLLVVTFLKSILTNEEQAIKRTLEKALQQEKTLTEEQKQKLNELTQKEQTAISNDEARIDYFLNSLDILRSKVKNFAKKVGNLQIIPIPIPQGISPIITKTNTAAIQKLSGGQILKSVGADIVSFQFAIPIGSSLSSGLKIFYDQYISSKISNYTEIVKITYFGTDGTLITNAIVTDATDSQPQRNLNKLEFSFNAELVKEPKLISIPSSRYELLG